MDLVSVVVPVYNTEEYVAECVRSILGQSHSNIELILVDDGSTDGSLRICEEFALSDSRVRVKSQPNSGVSAARNNGLADARGQYVCFVDSDDAIRPDYVERMLNAAASGDVDAVFCNYEYLYGKRYVKKKPRLPAGTYDTGEIMSTLVDDGTLSGILLGSVWCALYRMSVISRAGVLFRQNIRRNEDGLFNIEYCLNARRIRLLSDDYLYVYRQTGSSSTRDWRSITAEIALATDEIVKVCRPFASEMRLDEQLKARRVTEAFWSVLAICSSRNHESGRAIVKLLEASLSDEELRESYRYVDASRMNIYKRLCFCLMRSSNYKALLALCRYVYPLLRRVLPR